jgi:hypothetical protein
MLLAALLTFVSLVASACGSGSDNGPYTSTVAPGLHPRLTAADAVKIARDYLDGQVVNLLAPGMKTTPHVKSVVAVAAKNARQQDGCIPSEDTDQIVWVTSGEGDYMNMGDHPWSQSAAHVYGSTDPTVLGCSDNGPRGTIVIDDATGTVLGVYPVNHEYLHPTPEPS